MGRSGVFDAETRGKRGFTIVELLIVIVVIGILAAISMVTYNGVRERASFTAMKADMTTIKQALELYRIDVGHYPISHSDPRFWPVGDCINHWCGWNQVTGDDFIPGLSPKYIEKIPQLPESNPSDDTYLYQSRGGGKHYQLIRYREGGLTDIEKNDSLHIAGHPIYDGKAWGFKTNHDPDEEAGVVEGIYGDNWW